MWCAWLHVWVGLPAALLLVGRLGHLGLFSAMAVWRRHPCSPMHLPHCRMRLPSAGDVRCLEEARALMAATGADGVMSAEPLLMNPMLFDAVQQPHDVSGMGQGWRVGATQAGVLESAWCGAVIMQQLRGASS